MIEDKYGTKAVQEELLIMMKDFHKFCMDNDIEYSLSGGSVLGAIRHDGFIPWDDDIDVMVNRENFNKLMAAKDRFTGYSIKCDSLWVRRIRKEPIEEQKEKSVIDIFIMDNAPDNDFLRKVKVFRIKILQGMMKEKPKFKNYRMPQKILIGITYGIGRLFSHEQKLRMFDRCSQIGNNKKTKYTTAYNDLYKLLTVCYRGDTMEHLCLHDFEDTQFFVPESFDSYLTNQYGDYMTPPPVEERVPQHIL